MEPRSQPQRNNYRDASNVYSALALRLRQLIGAER
jgi:hypothetical protein